MKVNLHPRADRGPSGEPGSGTDPSPFQGDVVVEAATSEKWKLIKAFIYKNPSGLGYKGSTGPIKVSLPLDTDFASVPRPFVWLFPRYGVYTKSAILHDHLCETGLQEDLALQADRADADRIFRVSMEELDVSLARRWVMWAGVRADGMWTAVRTGAMWRAIRSRSVLKAGRPKRAVGWFLIAAPTAAFLAVPAVVVSFWLFLFYVIEIMFYLVLKILGQEPRRPRLFFKTH